MRNIVALDQGFFVAEGLPLDDPQGLLRKVPDLTSAVDNSFVHPR